MFKRLFFKIADLRVLDGYIGILGLVLWYRILADYVGAINLVSFSARAGKISLFNLTWNYHSRNCKTYPNDPYPPFTFRLSIGKLKLIDTGAKAAEEIHNRVESYLKKGREEEAERDGKLAAKLSRLAELEAKELQHDQPSL